MKKFTYIIIALILLIYLTAINVFAGNINKAKIGQKMFAQAIDNKEITISNNEDDDFKEIDEIIGNCEISDEELAKVVGERLFEYLTSDSGYNPAKSFSMSKQSLEKWEKIRDEALKRDRKEKIKSKKEMVEAAVTMSITILFHGTIYTITAITTGGTVTIAGIACSTGSGIVEGYILNKLRQIAIKRIEEHYNKILKNN